jgi:hypothetical protein
MRADHLRGTQRVERIEAGQPTGKPRLRRDEGGELQSRLLDILLLCGRANQFCARRKRDVAGGVFRMKVRIDDE